MRPPPAQSPLTQHPLPLLPVRAEPPPVPSPKAEPEPGRRFGPHWYQVRDRNGAVFHTADGPHFKEALRPFDTVTIDLDYAIRTYSPPYIGLVFFMGIGDYLFVTPFLRQLRKQFPHQRLVAFVSGTTDSNNNPAAAELLAVDPSIDEVRVFVGGRSEASAIDWRNYDISRALAAADAGAVILPLLYDYDIDTRGRVESVCRGFGLTIPDSVFPVLPAIPPPSDATIRFAGDVWDAAGPSGSAPVVFLHLETRSGNYAYPHAAALCRLLLDLGCVVVHVTGRPGLVPGNPAYFEIDVRTSPILESFAALIALHRQFAERMTMIAVPSAFAAASSGLRLPCLQVQHRYDYAVSSIWYPNLTLLTHRDYPALPASHVRLAERGRFQEDAAWLVTYQPDLVAEAWQDWCSDIPPVNPPSSLATSSPGTPSAPAPAAAALAPPLG